MNAKKDFLERFKEVIIKNQHKQKEESINEFKRGYRDILSLITHENDYYHDMNMNVMESSNIIKKINIADYIEGLHKLMKKNRLYDVAKEKVFVNVILTVLLDGRQKEISLTDDHINMIFVAFMELLAEKTKCPIHDLIKRYYFYIKSAGRFGEFTSDQLIDLYQKSLSKYDILDLMINKQKYDSFDASVLIPLVAGSVYPAPFSKVKREFSLIKIFLFQVFLLAGFKISSLNELLTRLVDNRFAAISQVLGVVSPSDLLYEVLFFVIVIINLFIVYRWTLLRTRRKVLNRIVSSFSDYFGIHENELSNVFSKNFGVTLKKLR